jgi:hypothetical protein
MGESLQISSALRSLVSCPENESSMPVQTWVVRATHRWIEGIVKVGVELTLSMPMPI